MRVIKTPLPHSSSPPCEGRALVPAAVNLLSSLVAHTSLWAAAGAAASPRVSSSRWQRSGGACACWLHVRVLQG